MATQFPNNLDTFVDPHAADRMNMISHSAEHDNANDAIVALETKIGIDNSTNHASFDYRIRALESDGGGNSPTPDPYRQTDLAWSNFPPYVALGSDSDSTGTLVGSAIYLPAGLTISDIAFTAGSTGSSWTHRWFGLADSSYNYLAFTADQTTTVPPVGQEILAIATTAAGSASTFTTTYSGIHYLMRYVAFTGSGQLPIVNGIGTGATTANPTPTLAWIWFTSGYTGPPAIPGSASTHIRYGYWYWCGVA